MGEVHDATGVIARLEPAVERRAQHAVQRGGRETCYAVLGPAVAMVVDRDEEQQVVPAQTVGGIGRVGRILGRIAAGGRDHRHPELDALLGQQVVKGGLHVRLARIQNARLIGDLAGQFDRGLARRGRRHQRQQQQEARERDGPNERCEPGGIPHVHILATLGGRIASAVRRRCVIPTAGGAAGGSRTPE